MDSQVIKYFGDAVEFLLALLVLAFLLHVTSHYWFRNVVVLRQLRLLLQRLQRPQRSQHSRSVLALEQYRQRAAQPLQGPVVWLVVEVHELWVVERVVGARQLT